MTGVDIVGALLRADPAILEMVPIERIKAGVLPDGVALPALLIRTVSSVDWQPLKRGQTRRTTDRTSVAVRAGNYRDQGLIIKLVRTCCIGVTGDIGGGSGVSILNAGVGPDVGGPANSFEQTADLRVSFNTAT
jgi:hypothetical protein